VGLRWDDIDLTTGRLMCAGSIVRRVRDRLSFYVLRRIRNCRRRTGDADIVVFVKSDNGVAFHWVKQTHMLDVHENRVPRCHPCTLQMWPCFPPISERADFPRRASATRAPQPPNRRARPWPPGGLRGGGQILTPSRLRRRVYKASECLSHVGYLLRILDRAMARGHAILDSGAKCNRAMQTGFARLCQAL
jgi:hypothetical protein